MSKYNEDTIEQAALLWLQEVGYEHIYGPDIAPDQPAVERSSYRDVILSGRLQFFHQKRDYNMLEYPQKEV